MFKFLVSVVNFILSLLFGGVAVAAAIFTAGNVVRGYIGLFDPHLIQIKYEGTFIILGVTITLIAYSITAALRGWSNPLGKSRPGNDEWR
jgi:hypothetical protein